MIIEVDCNNDTIQVDECTWSAKNMSPNQLLIILEEILTRINGMNDKSIQVELVKIDEDRRTTVAEW